MYLLYNPIWDFFNIDQVLKSIIFHFSCNTIYFQKLRRGKSNSYANVHASRNSSFSSLRIWTCWQQKNNAGARTTSSPVQKPAAKLKIYNLPTSSLRSNSVPKKAQPHSEFDALRMCICDSLNSSNSKSCNFCSFDVFTVVKICCIVRSNRFKSLS